MPDRRNIPAVLVGLVPLFAVTNFVLNEGYEVKSIAGTWLTQSVTPTTRTISIEALLIGEFRALRPVLQEMGVTSRLLAASPRILTGVPVVTQTSVHLNMQITDLVFTQDSEMRDTLKVSISLTHVPRAERGGVLGSVLDVVGVLDLAVGAGSPFI
jgi:hypothetical protein